MDVVLGIKNIQRNLEPESQWKRVITCMQKLSNFEIAQAWVILTSSINTQTNDAQSIVIHSQYKMIFDRALAEAFPEHVQICSGDSNVNTDTSVLEKYKEMLDEYHRILYLAVITMRDKNYPINIGKPTSAVSEDSSDADWPIESVQPATSLPVNRPTELQLYEPEETTTGGIRPSTGQSSYSKSSKESKDPLDEIEHSENAIKENNDKGTSHVDEESLEVATERITRSKIQDLQTQIHDAEQILENINHPHGKGIIRTRDLGPEDSPLIQDAKNPKVISKIAYKKELEEKILSWKKYLEKLRHSD